MKLSPYRLKTHDSIQAGVRKAIDGASDYLKSFQRHEDAINEAAATDGVFPLVDKTDQSAVEVLKIERA